MREREREGGRGRVMATDVLSKLHEQLFIYALFHQRVGRKRREKRGGALA